MLFIRLHEAAEAKRSLPRKPILVKNAYLGIKATAGGRMIVPINTMNRMFLPGNLNRANPYATSADAETAPTRVTKA